MSSAPAPAHSPFFPSWTWWVIIGLLVAAAIILGGRRAGLRITVERTSASGQNGGHGDDVAGEG